MAVSLLNGEVSELCLGKPELTWVAARATISDALTALRTSGEAQASVWICSGESANGSCICVGKFSLADVILFLCQEDNLADPVKAFEAPVSDILPESGFPVVRRLESNSSLLEAIDYILEGTQNLVIPTENHHTINSRKKFFNRQQGWGCDSHNGTTYCWLTQEDVVRFLFNSIGAFSPIPTFSIESLNVIDHDIVTVPYDKPAASVLGCFSCASNEQKPVAVVDEEKRFIGEISPFALASCDETAAAAIMALSAVDLMAYIDYGDPPEDLVQLVKARLEERNLRGMVDLVDEFFHSSLSSSSSSCSSDDDSLSSGNGRSNRSGGWGRYFPGKRSEAVVCNPGSSLVAVMIQALANRVTYVWVVEEDQTLVGAVTFAGILNVLRNSALGVA